MNKLRKKRKYRMLWIILSVLLLIIVAIVVFINQPKFGRTPQGERLERVKNSPNYRDGQFQNLSETPQITSDKSRVSTMLDFLFRDSKLLAHPTIYLLSKQTY